MNGWVIYLIPLLTVLPVTIISTVAQDDPKFNPILSVAFAILFTAGWLYVSHTMLGWLEKYRKLREKSVLYIT